MMKRRFLTHAPVALALLGCVNGDARTGDVERAALALLRDPPEIRAAPGSAEQGPERAAAEAMALLQGARDSRAIEAPAAPLIASSAAGRAFLAAAPPARALAQGAPPARCPAMVAAEAGGPEAAARRAFEGCLVQLRTREAPPACGCRLLAIGDMLTAPIEAFAFAPGVGARLIGAAGLGGRPLIAEQSVDSDAPDALLVTFRDAAGPVAQARLDANGRATLLVGQTSSGI